MKSRSKRSIVTGLAGVMLIFGGPTLADQFRSDTRPNGPSITLNIPGSTQGPLWPPSEVLDKDGNFVVIGNILRDTGGGVIKIVPGAALVSAETVPPLDRNGREDFFQTGFGSLQNYQRIGFVAGQPGPGYRPVHGFLWPARGKFWW